MNIDIGEGLFGALREDAGSVWLSYINHPFVKALGNGTLPEQSFRKFLTQDYLFLINFVRASALLVAKSQTFDDISDALTGLLAIVDEMPLHVTYCAQWGITEEEMKTEQEEPATAAYNRYLMDIGHNGDRLDLLAALMPCIAGYAEIGIRLAHSDQTIWKDNPYANWIRNYENSDYQTSVTASIALINRVGRELNAEMRFASLSSIFKIATRLETDFWQMAFDAA